MSFKADVDVRSMNRSRRALRRRQLLTQKKEIQVVDGLGQQVIDETDTTVHLTNAFVNNDAAFFVLESDEITIKRDCALDCSVTVTLEAETTDGEFDVWIEKNGVEVPGSRGSLQLKV